jgi:hypothetical protein
MAIRSGFFNSVNGDRRYLAYNFAEYFASFIANGVFPNPSTGLQVYEKENMTITVKPGRGWINGYFIVNESDYDVTLATADGALNRIDRIVLRLDYINREITIAVKQGMFASSPVAAALQRDTDAYELAIADVYVGKGSLSISQVNITDLRLNTDLCGIVHGTVDQVDTTTIFNQYQAWFNETTSGTETEINDWQAAQEQDFTTWSAQQKSDFDEWFATIQGTLSGDVAGNLQAQITQLDTDLGTLEETVAAHSNLKATKEMLGHLQVGSGLSVDVNGIISHPTGAGNNHIPSGGTTGQVLGYGGNSGVASWVDMTGGAWEKIAEITLTGNTTQVDFANLGLENYQQFQLLYSVKQTLSGSYALKMRFNDIATNSYVFSKRNLAAGSLTGSDSAGTNSYESPVNISSSNFFASIINIYNLDGKIKHIFERQNNFDTSLLLGSGYANLISKINKISLFLASNQFATSSTFILLGVR